jgi:hypothetical protein
MAQVPACSADRSAYACISFQDFTSYIAHRKSIPECGLYPFSCSPEIKKIIHLYLHSKNNKGIIMQ